MKRKQFNKTTTDHSLLLAALAIVATPALQYVVAPVTMEVVKALLKMSLGA